MVGNFRGRTLKQFAGCLNASRGTYLNISRSKQNEVLEMSISYHLKALLADANMTQKELAEVTGIRPPTISALCLGTVKQLPIGVLEKICTVLNCQPGDILEYVPDESEQ